MGELAVRPFKIRFKKMFINGCKERSLVFKNITITLLVFSPFILISILATVAGILTPLLSILMVFSYILILYIFINEIIDYTKSSDRITIKLSEGLISMGENQQDRKFRKVFLVGNGKKTNAYRIIIVKLDGSEEFIGRYYIFDKCLGDIKEALSSFGTDEVEILNGFQLVNRKIFGS